MNVALSFDKKFSMQAAVTIASISVSNAESDITFHLLTDSIDDTLKEKICFSLKYACHKAIFYTIDEKRFRTCPVNKSLACPSLAKYYRLLLPTFLPKTIERVLYLDCDIIVVDSLVPLFKMDMKGKAIGVVLDQKPYILDNYNRLCLDLSDGYFNSGVILFDLCEWRNHEYSKEIFAYIEENAERLVWEDQDALNKVFAKNKLYLPIKYNLQQAMMYVQNWMSWKEQKDIKEALKSPVCIHFCGDKPWKDTCRHPYSGLWWNCLNLTSWDSYKASITPFYIKWKQRLRKKINYMLGIDRWDRRYLTLCFKIEDYDKNTK